MYHFMKRSISCVLVSAMLAGSVLVSCGSTQGPTRKVDQIVAKMSMDEKISQMIIPAIRTWNEENVTDLSAVPELKEALQKHQYGGIILFGANIKGAEQVTRLIDDLQTNNLQNQTASTHIPYLTPVDEEGGIVIRLNTGTRMNGNMAIGATADSTANAETTGRILGEELAAVGFNTDYAPDIDVNNNPSNPVIGTRSFSDDPELVATLGSAYAKGLAASNIIATYKHFPGHGDTAVDSHIGTPSVEKTYEELKATELVPFKKVIENGADMIMTAHITYPLIDEEKTFGDGTKGFYPATMSKKMITDILRTDLGFNGVVVTDALEMDAIRTAGLVPGEENSTEYWINIAKEVINAGVDMLLLPVDMNNPEAVTFYDDYIAGIASKVKSREISKARIDESVKRILTLKAKYGIYDLDGNQGEATSVEDRVARSKEVVGSKAHHDTEMEIARQAITVVKNDNNTLPITGSTKKVFFLGRQAGDATAINLAADELMAEGLIDDDATVSVDYYYDSSADVKLHYTDEVKEKVSAADVVVGFSYASGNAALDKENPQYIAVTSAIEDTHKAGGKFVLISENLPYDAAIYQDADAIVLAYLGSGLNVDPTKDKESETGMTARNANIVAAIKTAFGANAPKGHLPVNVPVVEEQADGTLKYGDSFLYERGFGLSFEDNANVSALREYWKEGSEPAESLRNYVTKITDKSDTANYIPKEDRIAVFDMDGTLTCETFYTYYDTMMFIKYCLEDHPERVSDELKAAAKEIKPGYTAGEELARNFARAFAGMTVEELYDYAVEFGQKETDSFQNMRYIDGFYLPMVEVVKYLYDNDFTIYVISGTERTTTRAIVANSPISEYVSPAHVIGTEFEVKVKGYEDVSSNMDFKYKNGDELVITGEFIQKNLNANKSIWIEREIGQRPVLAFGNSGSDTSMMNYVLDDRNPYPSQAYMIVADDAVREWGTQNWEEKSASYREQGYVPISMKNDFLKIYPDTIKRSEVQYVEEEEEAEDAA